MAKKKWETYEQVAQYLLNQIADEFGLGHVEGKQIVPGQSGTDWEIEAKGHLLNDEGFVLIECRHYKSRLKQEQIGAIAYRIKDTGAKGGIVVSPLEPQSGAQKVAAYEGIVTVTLSAESTTTDYLLRFLHKVFVGLSATMTTNASLETRLITGECVSGDHHNCNGASGFRVGSRAWTDGRASIVSFSH